LANLSDLIEAHIKGMLAEWERPLELQRNDLAQEFGCTPSQINYVLQTRFSPAQGYLIESRRGGGGYIRVIRVNEDKHSYLHRMIEDKLQAEGRISERDALLLIQNLIKAGFASVSSGRLIAAAVSDKVLSDIPNPRREQVRAGILANMLYTLLWDE